MDWRERIDDEVRRVVEYQFIARRELGVLHDGVASAAEAEGVARRIKELLANISMHINALALLAKQYQQAPPQQAHYSKSKYEQVKDAKTELKQELRKANIAFKRHQSKRDERNREELLRGSNVKRNTFSDMSAVSQAREITSGLHRARQAVLAQIEHSHSLNETLQSGSKSLRDTYSEMGSLRSTTGATRSTTVRIKRREMTDRILVGLGVLFYFLIVFYIFHKRIGTRIWDVGELFASVFSGGGGGASSGDLFENSFGDTYDTTRDL